MNLLRQNEDEYILLDSNINYSENTAYISLEFFQYEITIILLRYFARIFIMENT